MPNSTSSGLGSWLLLPVMTRTCVRGRRGEEGASKEYAPVDEDGSGRGIMLDCSTSRYAGGHADSMELLHSQFSCVAMASRRLGSTDKHGGIVFFTVACGGACVKWPRMHTVQGGAGERDDRESSDYGGVRRTHTQAQRRKISQGIIHW